MDDSIPSPTVVSANNTPTSIPFDNSPKTGLKTNKLLLFIVLIIVIIFAGSGGYYLGKTSNNVTTIPSPTEEQQKGCTLEAKICPDGTSVGRSGPNCEFASCPEKVVSKPTQILPTDSKLQDCIEEETHNLEKNIYLQADQLSVVFYSTPSADVINNLAQNYSLEVKQIYKQPNVVFNVSKDKGPTVKCQLLNESEIKEVVFIENRPVP